MIGDGNREGLRGEAVLLVAAVLVLGAAGGIASATGASCSAATEDCRTGLTTATAIESVGLHGAGEIVGAPPNGHRTEAMDGEDDGDGGSADAEDDDAEEGDNETTDTAAGSVADAPGESESVGTNRDVGQVTAGGANADVSGGVVGDATEIGADVAVRDGDGDADGYRSGGDVLGREEGANAEDAPGPEGISGRETNTSAGEDAESERGAATPVPARVDVSTRRDANGTETTVVNASVRDAKANERTLVALEPRRDALVNRSNASAVAVTAMELSPTRSGAFTLNVTAAERIEGSPEFTREDGTEAMSRIRVNHSISNEEVNGTVDIDFRISKARLADDGVDPENVALYRFENGSWTELPTRVVDETTTSVRFRAESPGLSEFAAGAKRARFSVETVDVAVDEILVGEDILVHVTITNDGGADGEFSAQLLLDGTVVEERPLTIAAGGQRQTLFDHRVDDSGEYEVRVNDVLAGSIVVRRPVEENASTERTTVRTDPASAADPNTSHATTTVSGTDVPEPVFHPTALVFVLIAALVARVRRR